MYRLNWVWLAISERILEPVKDFGYQLRPIFTHCAALDVIVVSFMNESYVLDVTRQDDIIF